MKLTKSELKNMIREALREELLHEVKVPVTHVASPKVFVVCNHGAINNLDNFYLHGVYFNKYEAIKCIKEEVEYRIENYNNLDNTLYCYFVNPTTYDTTVKALTTAANAKNSGGVDLHYDYKDVVYALSSIAEHESPVYELSMSDIWNDYYLAYLASAGYDIETIDVTDTYAMQDLLSDLDYDDEFKKFISNKFATIAI